MATSGDHGEKMDAFKLTRRGFLKHAALGSAWALAAAATPWNGWGSVLSCRRLRDQRLRWIVPFSPGGGYDTYSRLIAPQLASKIAAAITVENVSGAGGILGALRIHNARPDGRTLGLLNAPGLLTAALTDTTQAPNPLEDFSILGRVVRSRTVWVSRPGSDLKHVDEAFRLADKRPLLCASTEAGSTNFVGVAVTSSILSIPVDHLAGFPGTRQSTLALIRGEVDFVQLTFESALDRIENGDLKVILQISDRPISDHPSLQDVPVLGGSSGVAARRMQSLGQAPEKAIKQAKALASLIGAGRLVAGPPGLPEDIFECLEGGLHAALTDPQFQRQTAKARRTLDVARSEEARRVLADAVASAGDFAGIVRQAIARIRE
jgi:tripartite-type tricarboxylate transporter receptor subunit TctC